MAKISLTNGTLKNWVNGDLMTAEQFKKEREIIVLAINDNYNRIKDLEQITSVTVVKDEEFEATQNQDTFVLTKGTYTMGSNLLEVSMEGLNLAEGIEFIELTNNSFKLSAPVTEGTRIYARWYQPKTLKLFSEDVAVYSTMGVF
jgi:hypothetical protein